MSPQNPGLKSPHVGVEHVVKAKSATNTITPFRQPGDPAVRADGACLVCAGERPPSALAHGDPFCSADCCRAHFGCPVPVAGGPRLYNGLTGTFERGYGRTGT